MKIKKSSALFRYWKWLHTGPFASGYMRSTFEEKIESASTCNVFMDIWKYSLATIVFSIIILTVICLMATVGNAGALLILVIGFLFGYGPNRVRERFAVTKRQDGFLISLVLFPMMLICDTVEESQEIPGTRKLNLPRMFGIPVYPILGIVSVFLVYFIMGAMDFFSSLETRPEEVEAIGYIAIVVAGVLASFGVLALWKSSFGLLARTYIKDRLKGLCRKIEFVDE